MITLVTTSYLYVVHVYNRDNRQNQRSIAVFMKLQSVAFAKITLTHSDSI